MCRSPLGSNGSSGDYIIGDVDGVIVVPQQDAEKIVAAAEAKLEKMKSVHKKHMPMGKNQLSLI